MYSVEELFLFDHIELPPEFYQPNTTKPHYIISKSGRNFLPTKNHQLFTFASLSENFPVASATKRFCGGGGVSLKKDEMPNVYHSKVPNETNFIVIKAAQNSVLLLFCCWRGGGGEGLIELFAFVFKTKVSRFQRR